MAATGLFHDPCGGAVPGDDPIYGATAQPPLALANISPRGERGVLRVSVEQFMRLRHNPFFPYMTDRIEDFMSPLAPSTR